MNGEKYRQLPSMISGPPHTAPLIMLSLRWTKADNGAYALYTADAVSGYYTIFHPDLPGGNAQDESQIAWNFSDHDGRDHPHEPAPSIVAAVNAAEAHHRTLLAPWFREATVADLELERPTRG